MSARSRLIVALASTGIIFYIAVGSVLGRVMGDTTYSQLAMFNEVVRMVLDSYVEPVNVDRAMEAACRGLTEALDGESAYLDKADLRLYEEPAEGSEADVGLVLTRRFAFLLVVSTRPGSPAAEAGLRPGDVVKTIDGRHTRQLAVPVGQRLLKGQPGSVVRLTILRASSDPIDFELVRERLGPSPPTGRVLDDGVGYVRVPDFAEGTARELRGQLATLRRAGAESLVLDLRGTALGELTEGVKVAGLLTDAGVVAQLAERGRPTRELKVAASPDGWSRPVAVLTGRGTAGAAEIVAAAVLDSGHGMVVGEPTFGIAAIQKLFPLPEGGLLLTVGKYLSPKGVPIHGRGVEPSVQVAEPLETATDEHDPILERARQLLLETAVEKAA